LEMKGNMEGDMEGDMMNYPMFFLSDFLVRSK